jgi:hypothetical protein
MKISNINRLKKLLINLFLNPDLLFPYFKYSLLNKKFPVEIGLPWWSFRAIERADKLFVNKRIFAYGSGRSTIYFARSAKKISCVEDDLDWKKIVEFHLKKNNIKNVEIVYRPFDFKKPLNFVKSRYISAFKNFSFDVIVIDGQDETFNERIDCFKRVEPTMRRGQIIVLDDFWRYTQLLNSNNAKKIEIYESVGPARIGVTSTAFFFY